MCLGPEVLAALALGAAGTAFNAHQQNKQQNDASTAASKATIDNLRKQREQAQRSRELFLQQVPSQSAPQQQQNLDTATAKRSDAIKANLGPATADYAPTQASAPKVVGQAQSRANEEGRAKVDKEAAALARMGGWGDTQQSNRFATNRTAGQISENNRNVQGIANLLPAEQQYRVGKVYSKPLSPVGDIAQQAGAAGVQYFWPQAEIPTFADVMGMKKPMNSKAGTI